MYFGKSINFKTKVLKVAEQTRAYLSEGGDTEGRDRKIK